MVLMASLYGLSRPASPSGLLNGWLYWPDSKFTYVNTSVVRLPRNKFTYVISIVSYIAESFS